MKRPALLIAICLAAGIVGGRLIAVHPPRLLPVCLVTALLALLIGFFLLATRHGFSAWVFSLLAWSLLGAAAVLAYPLGMPAQHVTRLVAAGRLDLSEPLRWRGRLRADPLRLPWGLRYTLDLDEVQAAGQWMPVAGGLRAGYYFDERSPQDPAGLRAGDSVEVLLRAERVRNFANPGAFDYRAFLALQAIDLTGTLRNVTLLEQIPGPPPSFMQRMARLRGRLIREVNLLLADNPGRAAVARAMLLGDSSFLDSEQIEDFQQTGAYHVLVVSGLNVGILAFVLLWVCRKLRLPLLLSTFVTISAVAAYALIVEDQPPILRAALMASAYLLAGLLFRRSDLLNAMGVAALLILAFRPHELTEASFLLSFLAAASIGGIAVPLFDRTTEKYVRALRHFGDATRDAAHAPRAAQFRLDLRSASNWLASHLPPGLSRLAAGAVATPCRVALRLSESVLLSLAVQVALLPLMVQYFHRVSVVAPAANLPAVLLTGIIVPYGFVALCISTVWPALGHVLGYGLSTVIGALIATVHWFALPGWTSFRVPSPPPLLLGSFFVVAVLLAVAMLTARRLMAWVACAVLLSLGGLLVAYPFPPRLNAGRLEVTVLDVGQGDSIFVAFPNGRTMLVDGGGLPGSSYVRGARSGFEVGEAVVSPYLWARGLKRLDVVALTHGHQDHFGGLSAVLRNFRVGQLWVGRDVDSSAYRTLLATAKSRGVPVIHQLKGNHYDWDGVRMRVLWPPDDDLVKNATNDDSIVLHLEAGSEGLLLAGDIERSVERSLVRENDLLPVKFLKVSHHGSGTSSTEPFLEAVQPNFAVISVGANNPFSHPNAQVLDRIAADGIRLFRTDRDGAVTALTDGHGFEIRAFLHPR